MSLLNVSSLSSPPSQHSRVEPVDNSAANFKVSQIWQKAFAAGIKLGELNPNGADMEYLSIRMEKLVARKGYLICATMLASILLIVITLAFGNSLVAAGFAAGFSLFLTAFAVNQWQIKRISQQIQTLEEIKKDLDENIIEKFKIETNWEKDLEDLKNGSLHHRLKKERMKERIKLSSEEFLQELRDQETIEQLRDKIRSGSDDFLNDLSNKEKRDFILKLKKENVFADEDSDAMGAVSKCTGLRPLLIQAILNGDDVYQNNVLEDLMPILEKYKNSSSNDEIRLLVQQFRQPPSVQSNDNLDVPQNVEEVPKQISQEELVSKLISRGVFDCPRKRWHEISQLLNIEYQIIERQYFKEGMPKFFPMIDELDRNGFFEGKKAATTYFALLNHFGLPGVVVYEYRQSLHSYRSQP